MRGIPGQPSPARTGPAAIPPPPVLKHVPQKALDDYAQGLVPRDPATFELPADLGLIGVPPPVAPPLAPNVAQPPFHEIPPLWFERLCADVASAVEGAQFRLFGKEGQPDDGIDMYATRDNGALIAWQAKRRRGMSSGELRDAVSRVLAAPHGQRVGRLVVVGPFDDRDRHLLIALEDLRLAHPRLDLELIGRERLTAELRNLPKVVRTHLGDAWRDHLCGGSTRCAPDRLTRPFAADIADVAHYAREYLHIDYAWTGPYAGEFGQLGARLGDALYQAPTGEVAAHKPSYYQTYWGLSAAAALELRDYPEQVRLTRQAILARFQGRPWIGVTIKDYATSPTQSARRIESVRHTVRAAAILLSCRVAIRKVAEIAWAIADEAGALANGDGGWSEFRPGDGSSSLYSTLYVLHFLRSLMSSDVGPRSIPEWDTFVGKADDICVRAESFLADRWSEDRWAFGEMPWQVNAPIVLAEVAPALRAEIRADVCGRLCDTLTPTGRLRQPDIGDQWDAPEDVLAVRTAFAVWRCGQQTPTGRAAQLRSWVDSRLQLERPLRTCDVAFLAHMSLQRPRVADL